MTIREIKQDAKLRTKGKYLNLIIINVLYSLILSAFTYATTMIAGENDASIQKVILSLFVLIITIPFSYGVLASTIKIIRGEIVSSTEFINIGLKNFSKVWKLTLRTFLKLLLPFAIMMISIISVSIVSIGSNFAANIGHATTFNSLIPIFFIIFFASYIYLIVKALSYVFSNILLYDNSELTSKEILTQSESLMKGNKWKYVGFILSFFGWYLLIFFVGYFVQAKFSIELGNILEFIFTAFLSPYVSASQIVFYEDKLNNPIEKQ